MIGTTFAAADLNAMHGRDAIFADAIAAANDLGGHSLSAAAEDAANPVNNTNWYESQFLKMRDVAGNVLFDLAAVAFTASGFTVAAADIVSVQGTAKKWIALAIESHMAGGEPPAPQIPGTLMMGMG